MIGIDTNVIVRYLVQDDPNQSAAASTVIDALTEDEPGFLSLVTIVELYWVLRRAYKINVARCAELLERFLDAGELRIGQESVIRTALSSSADGLDFADALIAELGRVGWLCSHGDLRPARGAVRSDATSDHRLSGIRLGQQTLAHHGSTL